MSVAQLETRPPTIRPAIDSRPPVIGEPNRLLSPAQSDQPPLDLRVEAVPAAPFAATPATQLLSTDWTVDPRPDLPDALGWSATLAPAVLQALLAQRPVAQLNRWLADPVLADVVRHARRRQRDGRVALPVVLRSLRVAHPTAVVAEAAARLTVGGRGLALAFRLEALEQRWLCTAFELGPRGAAAWSPEEPTL